MRRAARAVPLLAAVALALAALLPAGIGSVAEQPTRIVLVSPANGALLGRSYVTFSWRVEWPRPPASGTVEVIHRQAADRAFTREVTTVSRTCPVTDVNCWTSYRPAGTFYGRYYWQVTLAGAVQATSQTFLFTAAGPRKAIDRARPRVRAFGGTARRGAVAFFTASVADNSSEVRLQAELTRRGFPVAQGMTGFVPAAPGARRRIRSSRPLQKTLQPGLHMLCVTAWDRAGNRGRACARYRVR